MSTQTAYLVEGHDITIVNPRRITPSECLKLARCGAAAWNAWREEFPSDPISESNIALFSGVDFSEEEISFSDFRLENVDFSNSVFGHYQEFRNCHFGRANFSNTKFLHFAHFEGSRFSSADFEGSHFEKFADFKATFLGGTSKFQNCIFKEQLFFGGAFIAGDAYFDNTIFAKDIYFNGTLFGNSASFVCCQFRGDAIFEARSFEDLRRAFEKSSFSTSWSQIELYAENHGVLPSRINELNCNGSHFHGKASFRGREFLKRGSFDFTHQTSRDLSHRILLPVKFSKPPEFFDCKLNQQVSFDFARFPTPVGDGEASRCYRVLKQAFSLQQATREEQRFFRLEMAEEAQMAWSIRGLINAWSKGSRSDFHTELPPPRIFYWLYSKLSNFGFSIARPFALFFGSFLVATSLYAFQADLDFCWKSGIDCNMTTALFQFAASQSVPGIDRLFAQSGTAIFGAHIENFGFWTTLTVLFHKAASLLALFLIGLALRNLFKMK